MTNLELEVTKSGLEASKTEAIRVSKQRLNVESEMQQLREETNLLQSRLSNAEYENKQKQVHIKFDDKEKLTEFRIYFLI